jgi:hypothetical protein
MIVSIFYGGVRMMKGLEVETWKKILLTIFLFPFIVIGGAIWYFTKKVKK